MADPFVERVSEGMRRGGVTLRSLCRDVAVDPSFFSKVLSGKRSPPSEEQVLRRIARRLGLDETELIVSAGRIPSEWRAVWSEPELFHRVHRMVTGKISAPSERVKAETKPKPSSRAESHSAPVIVRREMSEELL
jgi:hypothetical protein